MNWKSVSFDWNHVRGFLATVEEGSLSAGARALGVTQPTLSRQISALEQSLGLTLFERGHRSSELTAAGLELVEHVRVMYDAATHISLTASGQSQTIKGHIKISCTNNVATYHLAPILKRLRLKTPEIEIELVTSNNVSDLKKREADIAIRHGRPDQLDLIAKRSDQDRAGDAEFRLLMTSDKKATLTKQPFDRIMFIMRNNVLTSKSSHSSTIIISMVYTDICTVIPS